MLGSIIETIILGAIYSGLWALVSSGFTLVFGVGRIVNLSHGMYVLIGGYFTIALMTATGNIWLSMIIGIALVGVVGAIIQKLVIENLDRMEMIIIATMAIALFVERIILRFYSYSSRSLTSLIGGSVGIAGTNVPYMRILAFVCAFGILGLLYFFITKTKIGAAIEATAQDTEVAKLVGIKVENILIITMAISAMLAGLAGVFWTQIYTITPGLSWRVLLYAFAIVILGGLGSIKGSIVGSLIVGYVASIIIQYLGVRYAYIAVLVVIIITLVIKPSGLFGKEQRI